ncbi:DUF433 domain-containing protein [Hydrogenophaga sp. YM1]|uniref:DUF433 domain-containing protein n=1 Tax=Hydrogenophaga sp. YM1 TaxID=2806262 RepID=UPI001EF6F275|nr:DUF433 domain-containing protein [Hydrogenophaga sp. YM1]
MTPRNKLIGGQLRAALRASRWNADTHALRLHLSRSTMAKVLVGDEDVSLRIYQLVAESLDCNIECVPTVAVAALVTTDPEILQGTPVFIGSRVPIVDVLASLSKGIGLERLQESYPFLTPTHIRAARWYVQEHPPTPPHRLIETLVDAAARRLQTIAARDRVDERSSEKTWDSFAEGPRVSDDFLPDRGGGSGGR